MNCEEILRAEGEGQYHVLNMHIGKVMYILAKHKDHLVIPKEEIIELRDQLYSYRDRIKETYGFLHPFEKVKKMKEVIEQ